MLSKRDVENVFKRTENGADWQYWRDSGTMNCWLTSDGEWLIQASHEANRVAICDLSDRGFDAAAGEYSDDRHAVKLVAVASKDPQKAYDYLHDKQVTKVSASVE